MTTEILGFIIILGAVIVLLARQHLNKSEDDPEVLEAATGRLRYELEQSADEIINRMTEHIDRLERMLREADYKSELLQQKIDMLERLGYANVPAQPAMYQPGAVPLQDNGGAQQSVYAADTAVQTPHQEPTPVVQNPVMDNVPEEEKTPAAVYTPASNTAGESDSGKEAYAMSPSDEKAWEYLREASRELEARYEAQSNTMQSVQQSDALQQAVNIQSGNIDGLVSAAGTANAKSNRQTVGVAGTGQAGSIDEPQGLDTEAATQMAREMLVDGHELEEIARATGLGIGAVHLIKQLQDKNL